MDRSFIRLDVAGRVILGLGRSLESLGRVWMAKGSTVLSIRMCRVHLGRFWGKMDEVADHDLRGVSGGEFTLGEDA